MMPYYDRDGITLYNADCLSVLPTLDAGTIDAVVTSPPYAMQRASQYGGIPEADYPAWTVAWMEALRPALTPHGSVLINIREHVKDGQISDYVHHTRLAVRAAGWIECEELIWIKPTAPPVGHAKRPRRSWERILWFSPSRQAWCNPQANGQPSSRIGLEGRGRAAGQWVNGYAGARMGVARCPDFVAIGIGEDTRQGMPHPATYPVDLAKWMLRLVVPPGGIACDPFLGSGTTARACKDLGLGCIGIECDTTEGYCDYALLQLAQAVLALEVA